MLQNVATTGENRNPNLQGPVWALLKSISSGRTTGVQTHQSFLSHSTSWDQILPSITRI